LYAFVDYYNEKDAEDALNALNGKDVGGRAITVGKQPLRRLPYTLPHPDSLEQTVI
jgi:RNA recognition motif-containing protein